MAPTPPKKKRLSQNVAAVASKKRPKKDDKDATTNVELSKKAMNISAGGVFYEKAKSRRERHRAVLMAQKDDGAVPLGRSSTSSRQRKPGQAPLLPEPELDGDVHFREVMKTTAKATKGASKSSSVSGERPRKKLKEASPPSKAASSRKASK